MPSWRQTTLTVKQLLDEQGAKRNDWGEPEPAVRCKCVARREQSTIRAPLPPCCLSYCQRNAAPVSRTFTSAQPNQRFLFYNISGGCHDNSWGASLGK